LTVKSRDLFQAEKKFLLFQAVQIHKMKTLYIQNGRLFSKRTILSKNSCHFLKLLSSRDLSQDEKRNTFVATERMCGNASQIKGYKYIRSHQNAITEKKFSA